MTRMQLTSPAFVSGAPMPEQHVSTGRNVSPPLDWKSVPAGTESFVVFCHDPDAPVVKKPAYGFVHWILYNIPGDIYKLPEDVDAYTFGRNDYSRRSYDGPRPPEGHGPHPHHYYFWLLALDRRHDFEDGLSLWDLLSRIDDNVLGMSRLIGTCER